MVDIRINDGRYRLDKKIGNGSTGCVLRGTDMKTGEAVAIKLESLDRRSHHLHHERECYEEMAGELGFPRVRWHGLETDFNCLVMDRVGENLNELQLDCGGKFTLRTVLILAGQMISRLESLHSHGLVHCDVKPSNFAAGRGAQGNCIFLIDLDLAKRYINPATGAHIEQTRASYAGTERYASRNTHKGIVQSRRDDLESLGYTLLYFLKGELPWQHLGKSYRNADAKRRQIARLKSCPAVFEEELLSGVPPPFATFQRYVARLAFKQRPNYDYLRRLFWDFFDDQRFAYEDKFDWDQLVLKQYNSTALNSAGPSRNSYSGGGKVNSVADEHWEEWQESDFDWTSRAHRRSHIIEALGYEDLPASGSNGSERANDNSEPLPEPEIRLLTYESLKELL